MSALDVNLGTNETKESQSVSLLVDYHFLSSGWNVLNPILVNPCLLVKLQIRLYAMKSISVENARKEAQSFIETCLVKIGAVSMGQKVEFGEISLCVHQSGIAIQLMLQPFLVTLPSEYILREKQV